MRGLLSGTVHRRGALLLEVVLALALFVMAGMAILSQVGQSVGSLKAAREKQHAADLARSAMAKIEAGVETAEVLNGPVPAWREETDSSADGNDARMTGWELKVQTEPSSFAGLTLVTITAGKTGNAGGSAYTLKQLVRLSARAEDDAGGLDDVSSAAAKGLTSQPSPAPARGNGAGSGAVRPGGSGAP
jgi:type II secretory pathway pseudopilin PulG